MKQEKIDMVRGKYITSVTSSDSLDVDVTTLAKTIADTDGYIAVLVNNMSLDDLRLMNAELDNLHRGSDVIKSVLPHLVPDVTEMQRIIQLQTDQCTLIEDAFTLAFTKEFYEAQYNTDVFYNLVTNRLNELEQQHREAVTLQNIQLQFQQQLARERETMRAQLMMELAAQQGASVEQMHD